MLHWKFLKKSESILTTELRRCHSPISTVHWKDSISPPQKLPWHLRGLGKVGNEWKWQIRQISKEKSRDASVQNLCKASREIKSVKSLTAKPLIFSLKAFSWTCCGNNFLALARQGPLHEKMVASACTKNIIKFIVEPRHATSELSDPLRVQLHPLFSCRLFQP